MGDRRSPACRSSRCAGPSRATRWGCRRSLLAVPRPRRHGRRPRRRASPAFFAAFAGFTAANWFFTPPYYELTVAEAENVVALIVFLGVAAAVSNFVVAAARARAEAQTLLALAATVRADTVLTGT